MNLDNTNFEYEHCILDLPQVLELMKQAIKEKKPFSLARFGHAEIYYALWPSSMHYKQGLDYCAPYNGATGNPNQIKELVIQSLKSTSLVGLLSKEEHEYFHSETISLLTSLNFVPNYICSPFITHPMSKSEEFWRLLKTVNVVLVGRRAEEAKPIFRNRGVNIVETFKLEGIDQILPVQRQLEGIKDFWDIAILAAGVPATILTERLANSTNHIVIDFGHALDVLIDGANFDFDKLVEDFNDNLGGF